MSKAIGFRVLELRTEDGAVVPITLTINLPRAVLREEEREYWECTPPQDEDDDWKCTRPQDEYDDWVCISKVDIPEGKWTIDAHGVDPLQALISGLDALRIHVSTLKVEYGDNLTFLGVPEVLPETWG